MGSAGVSTAHVGVARQARSSNRSLPWESGAKDARTPHPDASSADSAESAERLECVRFIGAFRPARDGKRFMVPTHAKNERGLSMNRAFTRTDDGPLRCRAGFAAATRPATKISVRPAASRQTRFPFPDRKGLRKHRADAPRPGALVADFAASGACRY